MHIAFAADPATYTVDTYQDWLKQYVDAKPDFKAGDVLTAKDVERMRPFVPPGYLEQLNFPNFKAQVIDVTFKPGFRAETMNGAHAVIWWHLSAIDVQNSRATFFRQQGPVMERYSPQLLKALFDPGALETIHRWAPRLSPRPCAGCVAAQTRGCVERAGCGMLAKASSPTEL
jgi:hypothetical protein